MRYLLFLALAALLAAPVSAAETANPAPGPKPSAPPDGVHGTTGIVSTDTVARALNASNKSPVVLTGHIVERVPGKADKYLFKDESGSLMVEISHEVFAGREITPESRVRLFGKLKKYPNKPLRVDVSVLQLLQ